MKRLISITALLTVSLVFTACSKVAEKVIESQSSDGTKTSVDISKNSAKMTTTDAFGKSSTMELGNAKITEADIGLPFYPGSKLHESGSSRMVTPESTILNVNLHSSDALDKVTMFYREKLKSNSQDKKLMDMSTGEGQNILMLNDDKNKNSININITKTSDSGCDIHIVLSREAAK